MKYLVRNNKYLCLLFLIFIFNFILPLNKSFAEVVTVFPDDGALQTDTTYQLTEDTILTTNLTIANGSVVTLDLNGYVLSGNGNGPVITNRGTLTLKDSEPNRKISYFEKSETAQWKWIKDATDDNNGTYAAISGGILTGGYEKTSSSSSSGGGGAIKMFSNNLKNVLNFEGGTVVGNKTGRAGGAFYGGIINMSGGLVIGNYAQGFSAAISISGNLTITGGEVSDQNVTDSKSTLYIENSNVVVGTSSNVYMHGGTLKGIITTRDGGTSKNTFSMTGGELIGKIEIRNQMSTEISGGNLIGNIVMTSGKCTISENAVLQNGSMENGSCVYITDGVFTMTGGTIKDSITEENGGAVKITNGTAKITGGTVQNCSAVSGGAIYVSGGDFELSGTGKIENCSATNGGGVSVQDGNVSILGGTITNSKATNGAGIYITNGNITMDGGVISSNQAAENGGGIYASSDTQDLNITISSGTITGNIANKNGGAVGVNMGTGLTAIVTIGLETCNGIDETHSHPVIQNNTSNENGGGFWLNGDQLTMNMYCGSVEKNIAVLEPGSSNIYQTGGLANVHSGTVGEGIIVIGGEYVSDLEDSSNPEVKISYDLNISGSEEILESYITAGVQIYMPKNIFTREDYVLVGWSLVEEPTENDTIYEVGTVYTVPENDVTLYAIWLRVGMGEIVTPIITSGRQFDNITGGTNLMLTSNSSFTIQMTVKNMQANLYKDRMLSFNRNLIQGTSITMIDLTDNLSREIYNYKVLPNNINSIPLTSFSKNGNADQYYTEPTGTDIVTESFLFIIDLPNENRVEEANQITLTRYSSDSEVASIEQILSYTTTEVRKFNISVNTNNEILNVIYTKSDSISTDSRYSNDRLSLVITASSGTILPEDMKMYDGTNCYTINENSQFIIPLGNTIENIEKHIQLLSKSLTEKEIGCNLNIELWTSNSTDATKPFMGEKVGEITSIYFNTNKLPSMNIRTDSNVYKSTEISEGLTMNYESINLTDYKFELELQKKNENYIYEKQDNILLSVNDITNNIDGIFEFELTDNGSIELKFVEDFKNQYGTYRILLKAKESDEIIWELPYNFILAE